MENVAATFDRAATDYEGQLQAGLAISGESSNYFVEGRLQRVGAAIRTAGISVAQALDFGCGVGNATSRLREICRAKNVIGLDCSRDSLHVAQQRLHGNAYSWTVDGAELQSNSLDLIYTSGVFHHIEPENRQAELSRLFDWLKPGGLLAFFENNPWNPGTRFIMSRIPFDRDAICLSPTESVDRLSSVGFIRCRAEYLFYFPRTLRWLRRVEPTLRSVPLGAQYALFAQKPLTGPSS